MRTIHLYTILLIIVSSSLVGCNDEIFVDRLPEIESNISLDGNGGRHTFKFRRKGLMGINFNNPKDYYTYVRYYDSEGHELFEHSMDDVAKITYGSWRFAFDVLIDGNEMTLVAVDNTYDETMHIFMDLHYGYTFSKIDVNISPGRPIILSYIGYAEGNATIGNRTETKIRERFTNNSDHPQKIIYHPYKDAKSRIEFIPDDRWILGLGGKCEVPCFKEGEWHFYDLGKTDITIGETTEFYSEATDIDEKACVEVPPRTTVSVTMSITYATAQLLYVTECVLPNSGYSIPAWGLCNFSQPIAYNIDIQ